MDPARPYSIASPEHGNGSHQYSIASPEHSSGSHQSIQPRLDVCDAGEVVLQKHAHECPARAPDQDGRHEEAGRDCGTESGVSEGECV